MSDTSGCCPSITTVTNTEEPSLNGTAIRPEVCDTNRTTGSPSGPTPGRFAGSVVFNASASSGVANGKTRACQADAVSPGFNRDHCSTNATAAPTYGSAL